MTVWGLKLGDLNEDWRLYNPRGGGHRNVCCEMGFGLLIGRGRHEI